MQFDAVGAAPVPEAKLSVLDLAIDHPVDRAGSSEARETGHDVSRVKLRQWL